tara:strand:+ start:710 stop:868 length:159 start_codon:yes stop_codon:yes gene_type:complete
MNDQLFEIDSAMNMIKEEMIGELYESVSRQNKQRVYQNISSIKIPFSEQSKD